LRRLLVYCYFCPDTIHRTGGVQHIVGPLIHELEATKGWTVNIAHTGSCNAASKHIVFPETSEIEQPDAINQKNLIRSAQRLVELASNYDVVLSIDRLLPCSLQKPCVLMSNTLGYQTEANAVQANQWAVIVVPTHTFAKSVRALNTVTRVKVVPYGLPDDVLKEARSARPAVWNKCDPAIVRLPHRPDRRKGHLEAIEGLALALPDSRNIRLQISWLNEARYSEYRREVEYLSRKLRVDSQIIFCGWLNGSERWQAVSESCAVLQVGSFEESFGLSIIESIVFGRPAVTLYQPAIREIAGQTNLYVEIADPLKWYEKLSAYWSRRTKHDFENQNRERLIRSLSLERMSASYDRILMGAACVRRS
jgi:glycosyltransferase involved in cell wall biosynthesis